MQQTLMSFPSEFTSIWISNSLPPPGKMVSVDFGQYNIRNTHIDHQLALTSIYNATPPTSKMNAMDVGRRHICNKRNNNQQAHTPISNQVPNNFISKI